MTMIDWHIEGPSYSNCNCDWSCPCQFESLPTHGDCRGFEVMRIEKGHFGDVQLQGLHAAVIYAWPGPIFDGHGEIQIVIDEQADESQREALRDVLSGKHTNEAATHWWVYNAMSDTVHDPLFKPFDFEVDIVSVWTWYGRPSNCWVATSPRRSKSFFLDGVDRGT